MSSLGWTWRNLRNVVIINLKNKSFHNSIDWSGFSIQFIFLHDWENFSLVKSLEYWEMHLKLSRPWHDLITNPLCRIASINLPRNICSPLAIKIFLRKRCPHTLGKTLRPCSVEKSRGGMCFLNICWEVD